MGELSVLSVSDSVSCLNNELRRIQSLCIPHHQVRLKCNSVPWFSKDISRLMHKRDQAFAKACRQPSSGNWAKFKRLRKATKCAIKKSKRDYLSDSFEAVRSSGDFWRSFRKCTNSSCGIPSLQKPDGPFAVASLEKAELLASTYESAFNKNDHLPIAFDPHCDLNPEWSCTAEFILSEIRRLSTSVPMGLDGISVHILSALADELAAPISAILNKSLADGEFPVQWKDARITAFPKKPGASVPSEFRPISILPVLSKIAERWLLSILKMYIALSPYQFAHSRGRSTEDALALLQILVANGFEQCRGEITMVCTSVSRRVSRSAVSRQWSVPQPVLRLLNDYLSNRTQLVCVDGQDSKPTQVLSGVPQGSVLGGFLFCAYVNSILTLSLSEHASTIMFADDLLVVKAIPSLESEQKLQSDLVNIESAYKDLFLQINPSRSRLMVFSLAPVPPILATSPLLSGIPMQRVDSLNYLGFLLDRRLNFDLHAKQAASNAKKALGALHRMIGRQAGPAVFLKLIQVKILPIFLYSLAVACPASKGPLLQLERLNRFAARLILNKYQSSYYDCSAFSAGLIFSGDEPSFQIHSVNSPSEYAGEALRLSVTATPHSLRLECQAPHDQQLLFHNS